MIRMLLLLAAIVSMARSHAQRQARYFSKDADQPSWELASANRTTNAQSTAFDTSDVDKVAARLNITAVGGSPSLTVSLETTYDGTNWAAVGAWPAKTATGTDERTFHGVGSQCRWAWLASAGGVTFGIDRVAGIRA